MVKPGYGMEGKRRLTDADIRAALESAGVIFINGNEPGVKLRKRK